MQLTLALPEPRQRKARPDTLRAAVERKHLRRTALLKPADPDAWEIADHIFNGCGSITGAAWTLQRSKAAQAWLAACMRAGLIEKTKEWSPYTGGHRTVYRMTNLGYRMS